MIKKFNEMHENKSNMSEIQKLIKKFESELEELEYMPHTHEDLEGLSDEDCMSIGETSGQIRCLESVIAELKKIENCKKCHLPCPVTDIGDVTDCQNHECAHYW